MNIALRKISSAPASFGVCSLPVLPGLSHIEGQNLKIQTVPIGWWPEVEIHNPRYSEVWKRHGWATPEHSPGRKQPRRLLTFFDFEAPAPDDFSVTCSSGKTSDSEAQDSGWTVQVTETPYIRKRDENFAHYCQDKDATAILQFGEHEITLRLGWQCSRRQAWWQWINAQQLWSGPLASAWQLGGHIYVGEEDRPLTNQEASRWYETPFADEQTIAVQAFVILYKNGCAEFRTHFINGELYGQGGFVEGKPLIQFESQDGVTPGEAQAAWRVDADAMQRFGGAGDAAFKVHPEHSKQLVWQPFAGTRQVLGHRLATADTPEHTVFVENSENGFPKGVARTAHFHLAVGDAQPPARYLAAPEHYRLTGEIGWPHDAGVPADEFAVGEEISRVAARVYLRNELPDGFCSGGAFRYLDNYPDGRWEFSGDGNETASFFRGSYLLNDSRLFDLALRNADFIADVTCEHAQFTCHYHDPLPVRDVYSLIYSRFGGLVHAHIETGDPYYLDTARAVANRWIATHRTNWPRRGIGRDAEPVEGILLLLDFTGQDYYLDAARQIARDVADSLYPDGGWRSGAGAGPYWGTNALPGTPWNGAHLISGIAEFLMRCSPEDPALPALRDGAARLLRKNLELLTEMDNFHRAGISFAWRRHAAIAEISGDEELIAGVQLVLRTALDRFQAEGEGFFKFGHHCAGYIDNPWFYLGLASDHKAQ